MRAQVSVLLDRLPAQPRISREAQAAIHSDEMPAGACVWLVRTLEHLARNGFLEVERDPAGWTVRLGARLRGYVEGAA